MKHLLQDSTAAFHFIPSTAWRALLLLALFATATTASIQAQTFTVLHTFTGDALPVAGTP